VSDTAIEGLREFKFIVRYFCRSVGKIQEFLGPAFSEDLTVAGSHGFEIEAGNNIVKHLKRDSFIRAPFDATVTGLIDIAEEELTKVLQGISNNVTIENNKYTLSVHYRNVESDFLRETVSNVVSEFLSNKKDKFVRKEGKMVIEIRPNYAWNKGFALRHIADELGLGQESVVVVLGDDITDEDAFASALALTSVSNAIPIFVSGVDNAESELPRDTLAKFHLKDVDEVYAFLARLVEWHKQTIKSDHTIELPDGGEKSAQT
jgi:trehalose 6-phosphate phosphatase